MFGAGRAFNLSFRPQPFGNPGSMRRIPMPMMGNYSQTTNVTIKNGPSGFWGFMGGLFGGLTGNVGMGGLFGGFGMPGMMGGAPCFMGMNTGIGSGVYGMLNGSQQNGPLSESQQIGNLKELFKGFGYTGVIGNGDGTFTIFGGDKGPKTMTYKEAVKFAETLGPKAQGTDPTGKKDNPDTKKDDPALKATQEDYIKNHPDMKLTRQSDGTALDNNNNVYEWKGDKYVKKETSSNPSTPDAGGASGSGASAATEATPASSIVKKEEFKGINGKDAKLLDTGLKSPGRELSGYKITGVGENNDKEYPKTITITKGGKTETMIFDRVTEDGTAYYKTTGGVQQEYRIEKDDKGNIIFTQRKGDNGYSEANYRR